MNSSLEQLVPRVFGFALRLAGDRHAAEDLAQETFLRACRNRAELRDERRLRVWLFQIAANLWRDQTRRTRLAPERAGPLNSEIVGNQRSPDGAAQEQEEVERALMALDALPQRQREVLYLFACEGLGTEEIAAVLECTKDAVKMNLSLARKKLRAIFTEQDASSVCDARAST